MNVIVYRGFERFVLNESLIRSTDYVMATDGSIQLATNFTQFAIRFRQPNPLEGLIAAGLLIGGLVVAADVVSDVWNSLFPTYNRKPLTTSDRIYIRERDDEICYYCGVYAPGGHVDHMKSRRNGGPNAFWNLVWACSTCNCAKGAMNWDEFLGAYEFV